MPGPISSSLGAPRSLPSATATSLNPFDVPPPATHNPADPDQAFFDALERGRSAALVLGMQGNVWGQAAVYATGHATRAVWQALQLNPVTARFYDGVVEPPSNS